MLNNFRLTGATLFTGIALSAQAARALSPVRNSSQMGGRDQMPCIFQCIQKGDLVGIERELVAGNVNTLDNHGETPLLAALGGMHWDIVELMLRYQSDVTRKGYYGTPAAVSKLLLNGRLRTPERLRAIIRAGADRTRWPLEILLLTAEFLEVLLAEGYLADTCMESGDYPLHLAAKAQDLQHLTLLISYGARLDRRNGVGRTALEIVGSNSPAACFLRSYQRTKIP